MKASWVGPDLYACPECGAPVDKTRNSNNTVRFHCGGARCPVAYVERKYDNYTKEYYDRVVLCVVAV